METIERESVRGSLESQENSESINTRKLERLKEDPDRNDEFLLKSPSSVQSNASSKRPESPHTMLSQVTVVGDLHQSVHALIQNFM